MAVGGNFTSCNCGPDVPACANPTEPVATVGLCFPDGTPIAVTVVRDCAGTVTQEGWIILTNGVYTAGLPPAGVAACDTGCVDTVCVQRCDDTDADGSPDATYSELWCIRADGTATLVLTYQGDPSTPYTPASPVECQYGCPETETVPLCDDRGPFLRRYTWLGGTGTFEDFALDGVTPHVVTGTVRTCSGDGPGPETPCRAQNLVQVEKCDDTDGDGIADACYVELLGVDCDGTPTVLGTYTCDLSASYTPTSPVDCDAPDSVIERPIGVQAHRVELNSGQSWDAALYGLLRTVQVAAHGGTGQITTAEGTSTLFDGERAEWAISRDMDVRLIGPLKITAATGVVVVNWTEGVDL